MPETRVYQLPTSRVLVFIYFECLGLVQTQLPHRTHIIKPGGQR